MASSTTQQLIFPWLAKYSVGIPEIDSQHQQLIRLINDLHAAMTTGQGKETAGRTLDELVRYTEQHFSYEERMLQQKGYSQLTPHQAEHKRLTGEVVDLREKYRNGAIALTVQVMQFLKNWLAGHIMVHDQQYAAELKKR